MTYDKNAELPRDIFGFIAGAPNKVRNLGLTPSITGQIAAGLVNRPLDVEGSFEFDTGDATPAVFRLASGELPAGVTINLATGLPQGTPLEFSVVQGLGGSYNDYLPAGLSLDDEDGDISGTPQYPYSDYTVRIQVLDASGYLGTKDVTFEIAEYVQVLGPELINATTTFSNGIGWAALGAGPNYDVWIITNGTALCTFDDENASDNSGLTASLQSPQGSGQYVLTVQIAERNLPNGDLAIQVWLYGPEGTPSSHLATITEDHETIWSDTIEVGGEGFTQIQIRTTYLAGGGHVALDSISLKKVIS